jgi:immune inhibitor A
MKRAIGLSVLVSVIAVLLLAVASLAAGPEPRWMNVDSDLEGPDYLQPPQYYRTLQMMLAESGLGPAPLGPPPQHVTGTRELLVILVELSDVAPAGAHDVAYFTDRFFDTSPPSVRDFYDEVSYGNFTYVPGAVLGWYASSYSTWHWDNDTVNDSADCRDVVYEAIQMADADFDFSGYDGNSDGTVSNDELTIFIIVSGNVGGAFHWYTVGTSGSLGPGPGSPTCDGKAIEGEFNTTHEGRHIGSYCHELGHDLGLPDLYDTNGGSEGIGQYGLMGGGSWTFSYPTAWCKIQLGWITPMIVTSSGYFNIDDAETHAEAFILRDSGHSTTEYFLVEYRRPSQSYYETIGAPTAPDGVYPDSGLVIYHIDDTQAEDWITSGINNVNTDETRKGVDVETAEHPTSHVANADDLDSGTNRGDGDDLWDCGEYDFHDSSNPCESVWYGGGSNDISVRVLPCIGPSMMTYLSVSNDPPVAQCQSYSANADNNCEITVDVADINDGSYDPDGAADIDYICIRAVDGGLVGCQPSVQVAGTGTHWVQLEIGDLHGLKDTCSAEVTVINTAPVAVCQYFEAEADSDCCITVSVSDINGGSYDPEGNLTDLSITAIDGSPETPADEVQVCGAEVPHTVTLTATDGCGLTHSCDATVTVTDVTPPEITVELDRYVLWPPNHKLVTITATIEVEDNCDPNPVVELVSITCNEPPDSLGDGTTVPDWYGDIGTDDRVFELRSERGGVGLGRIYTIVYTATDFSGNVGSATVFVRVPHDQNGGAFAAVGFNEAGTGFNRSHDEFVLVIPSRLGVYGVDEAGNTVLVERSFDATRLDVSQVYVGNTLGAILSQQHQELDNNGDGLTDLVLYYRIAGVEPLVADVVPVQYGEMWIADPLDPVGLHFTSSSGVDYLVSDIFALGPPVPLESGSSSGVGDELPEDVALTTGLLPISPNPFSRTTTIRYTLRSDTHVRLSVYDARGVVVRRLENSIVSSGQHGLEWDGRDDSGRTVSAGVYFVRFTAGSYKTTEKMMLLK